MDDTGKLPDGSFVYRHKSEGQADPTPVLYRYVNNGPWNGSKCAPDTAGVWQSGVDSESYKLLTGYDIVAFNKLKRNGVLLPHTPFFQVTREGQASGQRDIHRDASHGCPTEAWCEPSGKDLFNLTAIDESRGWNPPTTYVDTLGAAYDASYYVQQAAASAYSQGMDVLTFLAELHQTVRLFEKFLERLLKIVGSPDGPYRAWLEYRYGWRQIWFDMNDINDAFLALQHKRERIEARAGHDFTTVTTKVEEFYKSSIDALVTLTITDTLVVGMRGAISADFRPSPFIFNPIMSAWELLRFSFIIDWVVNIGAVIASLSFVAFTDDYTASAGRKISLRRVVTSSVDWNNQGSNSGWTGTLSNSSSFLCEVSRRDPTSVPLQPLPKVRLDWKKIFDLIAILVGYTKGIKMTNRGPLIA